MVWRFKVAEAVLCDDDDDDDDEDWEEVVDDDMLGVEFTDSADLRARKADAMIGDMPRGNGTCLWDISGVGI
jgi:hypothetical protein